MLTNHLRYVASTFDFCLVGTGRIHPSFLASRISSCSWKLSHQISYYIPSSKLTVGPCQSSGLKDKFPLKSGHFQGPTVNLPEGIIPPHDQYLIPPFFLVPRVSNWFFFGTRVIPRFRKSCPIQLASTRGGSIQFPQVLKTPRYHTASCSCHSISFYIHDWYLLPPYIHAWNHHLSPVIPG
jgi:hypothetical protein